MCPTEVRSSTKEVSAPYTGSKVRTMFEVKLIGVRI